jgi:hypothetical protein
VPEQGTLVPAIADSQNQPLSAEDTASPNVLNRAIAGRPISVNGPFTVALRAQERISWQAMLQGYWANEWQTEFCNTYSPPTVETTTDKAKQLMKMDMADSTHSNDIDQYDCFLEDPQ